MSILCCSADNRVLMFRIKPPPILKTIQFSVVMTKIRPNIYLTCFCSRFKTYTQISFILERWYKRKKNSYYTPHSAALKRNIAGELLSNSLDLGNHGLCRGMLGGSFTTTTKTLTNIPRLFIFNFMHSFSKLLGGVDHLVTNFHNVINENILRLLQF